MHFFRNHRFLSLAAGAAFAVSLLGGASFAQAASLSTIQIQAILNLLQAFGADTATIANVQAALENTATSTQTSTSNGSNPSSNTTPTSNSNGNCTLLSTNMSIGSTDRTTEGEVSRLQAFLGKDKSIYPEDAITGYFGSSTLAAVQRWQAAQGIVSSGNSESTGYGNVGPLTREDINKELEMECEMGDSSSSSSSPDSTASSTGDIGSSSSSSSDSTASSTGDVSGGENAKVGVGAHCGGFIQNAPQCAEGLHCQLGPIVDEGGTCVQNSEGSTGPTWSSTTTVHSEGN